MVRRLMAALRRKRSGRTGLPQEPLELDVDLKAFAGKWVALRGDRVIEAADTPYALVMQLHSRGIIDIHTKQPAPDITILRAPAPEEPLLVGLG